MACALAAGDAVVLGFSIEGVAESKEEEDVPSATASATATAGGGGDGGATTASGATTDGGGADSSTADDNTVAMEVSVKAEGEEQATEVQVKEESKVKEGEAMVKEEEEVGEVPEMQVEKAAAMEKVAMEEKYQQEEEEEVVEFVETVYEPVQGPWYLVIKPNNMGSEALAQVNIHSNTLRSFCLPLPSSSCFSFLFTVLVDTPPFSIAIYPKLSPSFQL